MLNFGIDVSRDKLDCAVLDEQGQRVKRDNRQVGQPPSRALLAAGAARSQRLKRGKQPEEPQKHRQAQDGFEVHCPSHSRW